MGQANDATAFSVAYMKEEPERERKRWEGGRGGGGNMHEKRDQCLLSEHNIAHANQLAY